MTAKVKDGQDQCDRKGKGWSQGQCDSKGQGRNQAGCQGKSQHQGQCGHQGEVTLRTKSLLMSRLTERSPQNVKVNVNVSTNVNIKPQRQGSSRVIGDKTVVVDVRSLR